MLRLFQNCEPIYNIFSKNETRKKQFEELPRLDLGKKRGATDYIDFIRADDMSHSLMVGVDCYRRPFLAIKLKVMSDDKKETEIVGTIFQRYSDQDHDWAYGTIDELNMLYWNSGLRSYDDVKLEVRLLALLQGKKVRNIRFGNHHQSRMDAHDYIIGNGSLVLSLHPPLFANEIKQSPRSEFVSDRSPESSEVELPADISSLQISETFASSETPVLEDSCRSSLVRASVRTCEDSCRSICDTSNVCEQSELKAESN